MITVNFTEQEVQNLVQFMMRVQLQGNETFAFMDIMRKLDEAARKKPGADKPE